MGNILASEKQNGPGISSQTGKKKAARGKTRGKHAEEITIGTERKRK